MTTRLYLYNIKQIYHSNTTTNIRLQNEINKNYLTKKELSKKYNVSGNTVKKRIMTW